MTCLVDRVLSGAGMKLHTSMLGTFFVYTLALSMPLFKKKSTQRFMEKMTKLFIVVSNVTKHNEKFRTFFQKSPQRFFLKNWQTVIKQKFKR